MDTRKMNVKPSGLLGADQQSERERRFAMAVSRMPSFEAAAPEATLPVTSARELEFLGSTRSAQMLDPKLIARSRWANRHQANFSGEEFSQLRDEIRQAGGNVQPIKVRPLRVKTVAVQEGEVAPQYEIVFGHRRHQACLLEGLPVLSLVAEVDDRTLFIEMDRENRARKDLTAWEQGVMYRTALETGLFASKRALASALGVDHSALSKAVTLAELPQPVIDAFRSPLELQFRWGQPLAAALAVDSEAVLRRAAKLKDRQGQLSARQVFEQLIEDPVTLPKPEIPRSEPILIDQDGKHAEVSMTPTGATVVTIQPGVITPDRMQSLAALISQFLVEK